MIIKLGQDLSNKQLLSLARGEIAKLVLPNASLKRIKDARKSVENILTKDAPVYGVSTGFGALANKSISSADSAELQSNLLVSHAVGFGEDMGSTEKRLALLLRIQSLCRGFSGVRPELIRWLIDFYHSGWLPRVPSKGSVGACGDLAPLAHLALPVIGFGELISPQGKIVSAKAGLKKIGLEPLKLAAKEGLALINGVQISNAVGLVAWAQLYDLSVTADIVGALSVEALQASHAPFDRRVVDVRPHSGAEKTSKNMRKLLARSQVKKSHVKCDKVQDPYSFRCIPQVHGAAKEALSHLQGALLLEANSVTDNPLIFSNKDDVISAGNFHGQPIALPLDYAANAVCSWGNISERRISTLINPATSGLPAFLTPSPGLSSGLMIPQVVAAALVSENKTYAHPASADSVTTSADQEDHVSMANFAARKLSFGVANLQRVLAIELHAAAQGRDFNRELSAGVGAQAAYELVRKNVPPLKQDRYMAPEIDRVHDLVSTGAVREAVERKTGLLFA
jgi:histidine ammonia-lyase